MRNFGKFYQEYDDSEYSGSYELLELDESLLAEGQLTITRFWVFYLDSMTFHYEKVTLPKNRILESLKTSNLVGYDMLFRNTQTMIDEFVTALNDITRILEDRDTNIFVSKDGLIAQSEKTHHQIGFGSNNIKHESSNRLHLFDGNEVFNLDMFGDFHININQTDDFFQMNKSPEYIKIEGGINFSGVHKLIDLLHIYLKELEARAKFFKQNSDKNVPPEIKKPDTIIKPDKTITEITMTNGNAAKTSPPPKEEDWSDIVALFGVVLATIISIKVNSWLGGIIGLGVAVLWARMKSSSTR